MALSVTAILPTIFSAVGVAMVLYAAYGLRTARLTADWPRAEGVVTRADLLREQFGGSEGMTGEKADIRYTYTVLGAQYSGEVVAVGTKNWYTNTGRAARFIETYPVGTHVLLAYDPRQPTRSVLEPGVSKYAWGHLAMGFVFVLVSAVLWELA